MENAPELLLELQLALKHIGLNHLDILDDYRDYLKDCETKRQDLNLVSVFNFIESPDDDPIFVDQW